MNTDFTLSRAEQELILFWRSLVDAEISITYQNGQPTGAKCFYPGLTQKKEVSSRLVDQLEHQVISTGRTLLWGQLCVHVENGSPMIVLNDSYQSVKFSSEQP